MALTAGAFANRVTCEHSITVSEAPEWTKGQSANDGFFAFSARKCEKRAAEYKGVPVIVGERRLELAY